jgi:YjbE family integral membrane protein
LKPLPELLHLPFIFKVLSIVVVDLSLSGDNAVVIAASARSLPESTRRTAVFAGAICAVVALVTASFFASRLLTVKFLQIAGGVVVFWIALGLFREEAPLESSATHLSTHWKAIWFMVFANVTMSTDNILAIAAIAQGDLFLLLFGLSLSIPTVFFASTLLAKLMTDYPVISYIGAALLGRVAGQMIVTDTFIVRTFVPSATMRYLVQIIGVIGVVSVGLWRKKREGGSSR